MGIQNQLATIQDGVSAMVASRPDETAKLAGGDRGIRPGWLCGVCKAAEAFIRNTGYRNGSGCFAMYTIEQLLTHC